MGLHTLALCILPSHSDSRADSGAHMPSPWLSAVLALDQRFRRTNDPNLRRGSFRILQHATLAQV